MNTILTKAFTELNFNNVEIHEKNAWTYSENDSDNVQNDIKITIIPDFGGGSIVSEVSVEWLKNDTETRHKTFNNSNLFRTITDTIDFCENESYTKDVDDFESENIEDVALVLEQLLDKIELLVTFTDVE